MTDTLLTRLEELANAATDQVDRSVFRAQWAGAMARLGRIEAARIEVGRLRAFNTAYSPRLTAWILIAEGLADHYESLSVRALDRFKRAYGLAASFGDNDIKSFASAWMSAGGFLVGDYENAASHAVEAIRTAPATGSLARSRAHLVLANILYTVGEHSKASPHYAKARHYAVEARDISMQSAVLYNVAAFHIARISLEDALGANVTNEVSSAELELNSVSNLDVGIGVGSLIGMITLLRAQLALVKKHWADADRYYSQAIPETETYGQVRWESRFLAEQSHCQAMLGMRDRAANLISKAIAQLSERVDPDDLAACHARLSISLGQLGNQVESARHQALSKQYATQWGARQLSQREQVASPVSSL